MLALAPAPKINTDINNLISPNELITHFEDWYTKAKYPDQYIYYVGASIGNAETNYFLLKNYLYNQATDGRVYLLQRKIRPFVFQYLCVKARRFAPRNLVPRQG